ncbi:hypothetical protein D9757_005021 [Collybiopsis confluens]|uniref:Uncharacterized protein n=1 Tax=Collybiopsis confluens TaxID=2823264 RepID=A0A8H5MC06_9AGAR|nr:hypothetical protein D9757_005021 [Collybiopsis confluens]
MTVETLRLSLSLDDRVEKEDFFPLPPPAFHFSFTMSTVWFMVDDTDPRLNYTGSWSFISNISAASNSFDQASTVTGPAFNSTLHSTQSNVTINFRFNGSSYLGVYGTQGPGGVLPKINCLLDGVETRSFVEQYPGNNMLTCRADFQFGLLSPGEHDLLINVTNFSTSAWFFDYITYESLANPILDGEVLQVGNAELINTSNYSMLSFGSGWSDNLANDSSTTNIPGSFATVKFNGKSTVCAVPNPHFISGTSMSLYGNLLTNISNIASYQVDAQDPVTLQLSASEPIYKQLLFTAPDLSVGEHAVVVTFNGSESGMPLDISYFYVQSLTAAQQTSLVSPSPVSPSPISSASGAATPGVSAAAAHSSLDHGIILGAVLGTLLPILVLASAIGYRSRAKRQISQQNTITPLVVVSVDRNFSTTGYSNAKSLSRFKLGTVAPFINTNMNNNDSSGADHGPRNPPSANNAQTLKLEQRLVVMQEQIQRRDQQLAEVSVQQQQIQQRDQQLTEVSVQQQRVIAVHTDSELRLTEEDALGLDRGSPIEVPPEYTVY